MRRVLYILGLLNDDDIDWLLSAGERTDVPAGETIIEQGQPVNFVFLVIAGQFRVVTGHEETQLASLMQGEIVGEISLLDSRPPTATVTADTDSQVLRIPHRALLARLESNDAFAGRFYKALAVFLAQRLRQTVATFGYGANERLSEDIETAEEIDPELLESITLAGKRFNWILERLQSR